MPDLARIAETSGLPPRKLRYVLDHGLLPAGRVKSRGRGAVRRFAPHEAFGLVLAARMLEAGLKRALVRACLAALARRRGRPRESSPLLRAFQTHGPTRLEVGDWQYVRLVAEDPAARTGIATGWLPLRRGPAPKAAYQPLVTLALDIGQIRDQVDRRDPKFW